MKQERYVIVPKLEFVSEPIKAKSAEEAMENFATAMDTDMNLYFSAILESELAEYQEAIMSRMRDEQVTRFMQNEFMSEYGLPENDAKELAEAAYERYCEGNGETEYECIEWAWDNKNSIMEG